MDKAQVALVVSQISKLYPSITKEKAVLMGQIMRDEEWSVKKARDGLKWVTKHNVYPTIEPGAILSYDHTIKFYLQEEIMDKLGKGTKGHKAIRIPDRTHIVNNKESNVWYVEEKNIENIPYNWEII